MPVHDVAALVGLTEKVNSKVKKLSGGQQRRLDVGLGIIGNPDLLFLDEPTTGLTPPARRTTWDLIRTLSSEGTTVLLTSHYMDEVEALAHRAAVLSRGRIVAIGRARLDRWSRPGRGHHPLRPAPRHRRLGPARHADAVEGAAVEIRTGTSSGSWGRS